MTERKSRLAGVAAAVDRASHIFLEHPAQFFQHVYNDLRWRTAGNPGLASLLDFERRRFTRPWLRLLERPPSAAPLVRTFAGHEDTVMDFSLSADGLRLLSAGADHTLKLWSTEEGCLLMNLTGLATGLLECSITPDGRRALSASNGTWDRVVDLWDLDAGKRLDTMFNMSDRVVSFTFSPDGRRLAFAGKNGRLVVRDLRTGSRVAALKGHEGHVFDCSFSCDSKFLVSVSKNSMKLWDVDAEREILSRKGQLPLFGSLDFSTCAFAPDGRTIVTGALYGPILVWDRQSGEERFKLQSSGASFAFHPRFNRVLAPADEGLCLREWDLESGGQTLNLEQPGGGMKTFVYSPGGDRIIGGNADGTLVLWDSEFSRSRRPIAVLAGHRSPVLDCAFSRDGDMILSSSEDGKICLWDARSGKKAAEPAEGDLAPTLAQFGFCLPQFGRRRRPGGGRSEFILGKVPDRGFLPPDSSRLNALAVSDDGRWGALARGDRTIDLVDFRDKGKAVRRFGLRGSGELTALAFSPEGRFLAGAELYVGFLRLWDVETGSVSAVLLGPSDDEARLARCSFSPDGRRIVSTGNDEAVTIWDSETAREHTVIRVLRGPLSSCSLSPGCRHVISGGTDGVLRLYDVESGRELLCWQGHRTAVASCFFTSDGSRLVSADADSSIAIWEKETGKKVMTIVLPEPACTRKPDDPAWPINIALGPGDRHLAVLHPRRHELEVWDLEARQKAFSVRDPERHIYGFAFSPDGCRLVTAGGDRTIRVHEVASGKEEAVLGGHLGAVMKVAFSPDGRTLYSAGADFVLKAWDFESVLRGGVEGGSQECERKIMGLGLTQDGGRALSIDESNGIRIFDGMSGKLLKTINDYRASSGFWWDLGPVTKTEPRESGTAFVLDSGMEIHVRPDDTVEVFDRSGRVVRAPFPKGFQRMVRLAGGRRAVSERAVDTPQSETIVETWEDGEHSGLELISSHGKVLPLGYSAFQIHPDGRHFLIALSDNSLRMIDAVTGKTVTRFAGHDGQVHAMNLAAAGTRLLTDGWDGAVRLWNIQTGGLVATIVQNRPFRGPEDFPNVWLRDIDSSRTGAGSEHSGYGGRGRIIIAGNDGTLGVWESETGRRLFTLRGHSRPVKGLEFIRGGREALSDAEDGTVRIWDLERGEPLGTIEGEFRAIRKDRVFLWDKDRFKVYDLAGRRLISELNTGQKASRFLIASPDGCRAVCAEWIGESDGAAKMHLWDVDRGLELASWDRFSTLKDLQNRVTLSGMVRGEACSFFPGSALAAYYFIDKTFLLFEVETGRRVVELNGYMSVVQDCGFCPRTGRLVLGDADGQVKFFALENFERTEREGDAMGRWEDGAVVLRRKADEAIGLFERGEIDEARRMFGQLEAEARSAGNGLRLQQALLYLGILRMKDEDWEGALVYFREQESICRELGLRPFLYMALGNQALALAKLADGRKAEEALRLFEEIETMSREDGDDGAFCRTLINKGRLLYDLDFDHARAREAYREAVGIARKLGDGEKLAVSLTGLAESLGMEDLAEIRRLCEEALPLAEEFCPPSLGERIRGMLDYIRFLNR